MFRQVLFPASPSPTCSDFLADQGGVRPQRVCPTTSLLSLSINTRPGCPALSQPELDRTLDAEQLLFFSPSTCPTSPLLSVLWKSKIEERLVLKFVSEISASNPNRWRWWFVLHKGFSENSNLKYWMAAYLCITCSGCSGSPCNQFLMEIVRRLKFKKVNSGFCELFQSNLVAVNFLKVIFQCNIMNG